MTGLKDPAMNIDDKLNSAAFFATGGHYRLFDQLRFYALSILRSLRRFVPIYRLPENLTPGTAHPIGCSGLLFYISSARQWTTALIRLGKR